MSGKREVETAERRGRVAGSRTAASLLNRASGSGQLLLWGSALGIAVSLCSENQSEIKRRVSPLSR